MANYPRPKSSIPKKPPRSSLHPHGAPTFAETIAGLKDGLLNLGSHLVGAGAGIAGNLIGGLANLKKSAKEGEEDAEQAYEEALAMLRGSGSSMAESLLRELGEDIEADEAASQSAMDSEPPEADPDSIRAGIEAEIAMAKSAAPDLEESVTGRDRVVCLECGAEFKRLTQSHVATHGTTLAQYRQKHGLDKNAQTSAKAKNPGGDTDREQAA
ncbi:MAG: MucR family transcriptional regulator [Acidobacteriota bacterium]